MRFYLKNKIILSIVTAIIFFGILATIFVFIQSKNSLFEQKKEDLEFLAFKQAEELEAIFGNSQKLVAQIAKLDTIRNYFLGDRELQDLNTLKTLENYNLGDMYSAIYLLDKSGNTLVSTDSAFVANNYGFRPYFKEAVQGNPFIYMAIGATSKEPGYYFSHPIYDDNNNLLGVIVAKQKAASIHDTLRAGDLQLEYYSDTKTMLIDRYGIVLFSEDENKIYKSLGELDPSVEKQLIFKDRFANIEITPLSYGEFFTNFLKDKSIRALEYYDASDGEEEILALAEIYDVPYYVFLETETENLESETYKIAGLLAGFVLLAALFAVLLIIIVVSGALKPLGILRESANKIAAGNLNEHVVVSTNDEFKELADTFNEMVIKLKKERDSVEKKVADRTEQLNKINKSMVGRELKMIELKKEINKLKK